MSEITVVLAQLLTYAVWGLLFLVAGHLTGFFEDNNYKK